MKEEKKEDGGVLYQCEVCKLKYEDRETAEACEKWCSETGSCNLEIIAKAVNESQ